MSKNKLDGSYSGLWSCELCGKAGAECHCEHFNRDTGAWGRLRTFPDSDLAAEYWRMVCGYYRTGLEEYREQAETIRRFAENPSYDDTDG